MGRNTDNAPVPHTCPIIDGVIGFLTEIVWDMEDELEAELSVDCKSAVEDMEKIRNANDTLRTWGNEECRYKEEFEGEKEDLETEVENLKEKIYDLEDKNKSLENEVESLKNKLYELT